MSHANTLATTKPSARKALVHMQRPEGMSNTTWNRVHQMLGVIVEFYPKACPSVVRIASIMGASERSVCRWIAAAQAADLLHVVPNTGGKPKRQMGHYTNRYWLTKDAILARDKYSYGVLDETSSQMTSSSVPKSARPAASPIRSTVISMAEWNDEKSRQVGTSAAKEQHPSKWASRPAASDIVSDIDSKRRGKKRAPAKPPRWRKLADYFVVCWQQMVLDTGQHKDTRPLETLGQCKTYIEAHFGDRSEVEVHKMMEEFVIAVSKRDITVKPGQSAWMCFTGAWGRQRHVQTTDPYAAYPNEG